ncbi:MAG: 2-dehydropantoate 2-reductase [Planctomycetes bacterium]|nr:2-dehydropantoate 2-reductase [Planctomycetota bacterium]
MASPTRHILIVGPGALGTLMAVRLGAAGHEVHVLDHRPDRATRLCREGLRLQTDAGPLHVACRATTSAAELPETDLAIVCVKCPALEAAGRQLAAMRRAAAILTIQNGLGVVEALRDGLGSAAANHGLVAAVTYQAANRGPDGVVRHVANLPTVLDGSPPVRRRAEAAAAILESAGLPATVADDLRPAIWRKLAVNVAINPLTALAHVRNGELAESEELRGQMLSLAREAAAVARAEGLTLSDEEAESAALAAARATSENISSMRQDVEAGRPTEIEFLGGALLRLAARHGLQLPTIADVTARIRALGT